MGKSTSKSYSSYLEKSEKYFHLTTILKIYMTRLILNCKQKEVQKNTFNNKKNKLCSAMLEKRLKYLSILSIENTMK